MPRSPKSHSQNNIKLPPLKELGTDLLRLTPAQCWKTILLPFACTLSFVAFALVGWWGAAILAVAGYTFYSYGSTSHDLVHGDLGLSAWLNHVLLSLVELIGLRSGHAYRAVHLNHHARYPDDDDVEGAAAHGSLIAAIAAGPLHQGRLWWWAMKNAHQDRTWIVIETVGCAIIVFGAVLALPITAIPLVWVVLTVLGGWTFPLITSYLPHQPNAATMLHQTIRFRGKVADILFLRHMYHLEHHLYPAVPHLRWPELAKRLDPFLDRAGVPATYIGLNLCRYVRQ